MQPLEVFEPVVDVLIAFLLGCIRFASGPERFVVTTAGALAALLLSASTLPRSVLPRLLLATFGVVAAVAAWRLHDDLLLQVPFPRAVGPLSCGTPPLLGASNTRILSEGLHVPGFPSSLTAERPL